MPSDLELYWDTAKWVKTDEDFLQHLTEEALGTLKDKYINDEQDACFTSFIKEVLIRELQDIKNEWTFQEEKGN